MNQAQALYAVLSIFAFVLGSIVGSFLNVCIHRLPKGESVVSPGSRCPKCGNAIAWYDNIPVVSWLLLGAKCRHCGEAISWQYPLVEAITGTLFFLVFLRFGFVLATPVYMALAAGLVLVTFVDFTDWSIPNQVTLPGIPISIGCAAIATWYAGSGLRVLGPLLPVFDALIGAAVGAGVLYGLDKLTLLVLKKRGMGLGDVKLLSMLGGFFGWPGVILIIVIASIVGSVVGIATMTIMKRRHPQTPGGPEGDEEITLAGHYLPFGPYLCFAGVIVMLFGAEIYEAYIAFITVSPV